MSDWPASWAALCSCVQENAADILASAKDINETRAAKEAETQVEDQEA